jgi:hypothetical protein
MFFDISSFSELESDLMEIEQGMEDHLHKAVGAGFG